VVFRTRGSAQRAMEKYDGVHLDGKFGSFGSSIVTNLRIDS